MRIVEAVLAVLIMASSVVLAAPDAADAAVPEPDHRSAPDPIEVALAVRSPLVVGVPFTLHATLTATWRDVSGASVSLSVPPDVAAQGDTRTRVDLVRDQPVELEFLLTPTAPGTHELRVEATALVEDVGALGGERVGYVVLPREGEGAFHQDLVLGEGPRMVAAPAPAEPAFGVVLASAREEGRVPGSAIPAVLPADEERPSLETGEGERGEIGVLGHGTFQVTLCWYYENEVGADTPQRYATIQVWDEDDFSDDLLAEDVTGNDGCYTSGNIPREDSDGGAGNQDVFVRIHLCNTWACVQDSDEDFYVYRVDYGTVGGEDVINLGGFKPPGADNFGGRAFQYANNGGYFAVNQFDAPGFSSSGPQVTVWAPSTDDSCDDGGMFFRRSENRIHVCSDSDRSPEDVGHEFGHWVHWTLYGYSFWPSPGGPHNLCTDSQNRGLSWTEGFANFYGPRVGNEVVAPSADNNGNYDRPWDGSSFSINMESNSCGGAGDDNEMRVAHSLWDVRDTANDGFDTGSASGAFISSVVSACDDDNFRDFFDGGGCNWISQGGSACTFMRAAFQNNVDFDDNAPTVSVTSQGAFDWVRGTITLSANAADADQGCVPSVEFRVSDNNACSGSDTLVGADGASPYSRAFDTTTIADNADVWTCAQSSDGLETSPWDASASHIGVDNTPPSVGMSVDGDLGNDLWWTSPVTVSLGCGDNLAGVAGIEYSLDFGSFVPYSAPFGISEEGTHLLILRCEDNAGNVDVDVEVVKIDTLDPSTAVGLAGAAGENGWHVGDVTVSMSCSDPVPGSGCFATQVIVTDPNGGGGIFSYAAPFVLTGDGTHNVGYHSADIAGNVEPTGSFDVHIDTVAPTGEITAATDGTFSYTGAETLGGLFTNAASLAVSYHAADATSGLQLVSTSGDADGYVGEPDVNGQLTIALPPGLSTWTLTVEDMAGHTTAIGTFQVVSIPPGAFAGGVDPRTSGWWKNAVKNGAYTQAEMDAMLPLVNAASHSFGAPDDRYGEVTPANVATYLQSAPATADERVRKELVSAWLNLVSGREPAAQAVDVSSVAGWQLVVMNTGGSSDTTALNVILEVERRLDEAPDPVLLNTIKSMLSSLNSGALNE